MIRFDCKISGTKSSFLQAVHDIESRDIPMRDFANNEHYKAGLHIKSGKNDTVYGFYNSCDDIIDTPNTKADARIGANILQSRFRAKITEKDDGLHLCGYTYPDVIQYLATLLIFCFFIYILPDKPILKIFAIILTFIFYGLFAHSFIKNEKELLKQIEYFAKSH